MMFCQHRINLCTFLLNLFSKLGNSDTVLRAALFKLEKVSTLTFLFHEVLLCDEGCFFCCLCICYNFPI